MLSTLRKIPFLRHLDPRDLKEIYKISETREYGPGEPIFAKSSSADRMFIVVEGRVKIFAPAVGRKRKTFAYLRAGDFFGEMALLEDKPRSASAEAVAYSKLLIVTRAEFNRLLARRPELAVYLLRVVSARLRRANEEIEGLLFRNLLGRVAKTLVDLSRRGQRAGASVALPEHYTQQELADLVGTTREPLTRALSALKRAQLLSVKGDRYVLPNLDKISTLCLIEQ